MHGCAEPGRREPGGMDRAFKTGANLEPNPPSYHFYENLAGDTGP